MGKLLNRIRYLENYCFIVIMQRFENFSKV